MWVAIIGTKIALDLVFRTHGVDSGEDECRWLVKSVDGLRRGRELLHRWKGLVA